MSEILIWGWGMYIVAFFEGRGFVGGGFKGESLILIVVVIMIEGIVFFEERRFVRDRSEDILMIVVIIVEGIIFFEGRGFVKGRFENELLMIIVIMVEEIIFAVFSLGDIRDLIVSVIVNLTNSIISLFMASERYED
jgi:hypothetical protein